MKKTIILLTTILLFICTDAIAQGIVEKSYTTIVMFNDTVNLI